MALIAIVNEATAVAPQLLSGEGSQKKFNRRRRRGKGKSKRNGVLLKSNEDDSTSSSSLSDDSCPKLYGKLTKKEQQCSVSQADQALYVAMDCEMVGVGPDGRKSALARVTMVDWNNDIIYDTYVCPQDEVSDYRTFVSGITAEDLMGNNAITFETCREQVLDLIDGKVIVGHALKNDLAALRIKHPWQHTRDTGKYEPFMKTRFDDGVLWPRKLRDLIHDMLSREIQTNQHSPYEDAMAALDLYKLVRPKWEKVMDYKIRKTAEITEQKCDTVLQCLSA